MLQEVWTCDYWVIMYGGEQERRYQEFVIQAECHVRRREFSKEHQLRSACLMVGRNKQMDESMTAVFFLRSVGSVIVSALWMSTCGRVLVTSSCGGVLTPFWALHSASLCVVELCSEHHFDVVDRSCLMFVQCRSICPNFWQL